MGRGFLSLGSTLLVATIALWVVGAVDLMSAELSDQVATLTLRAGVVLVAASLLLRVVSPVTKQIGKGRCTVCGAAVERGQIYCLDHLQQTVNAYRDQSRDATLQPPKRRG